MQTKHGCAGAVGGAIPTFLGGNGPLRFGHMFTLGVCVYVYICVRIDLACES